jgi:imidazoleglycerol phosphate dehydratase HisB
VRVALELDEPASRDISTGVPMLDHLLDQLAFHSGCGAAVSARSLDSIQHHLIEDTAIVFGRAVDIALGDRHGIARFGSTLIAMDDALARVAVDLGGRSYSRVALPLTAEHLEGLEVAMVPHFFHSLALNSRMTVHIDLLHGTDPHHAIEACFKAFACSCRQAWTRTSDLPATASTKGAL